MYIEFGSGRKQIAFYYTDKHYDIDVMLLHIVAAYEAMLKADCSNVDYIARNCRLIFSSERPVGAALTIYVSTRPCGIYVDKYAYHKQLAKTLYRELGFDIHQSNATDADLEIGIGGLQASTQGGLLLKDAILALLSNSI